jgi:hypothetical protein
MGVLPVNLSPDVVSLTKMNTNYLQADHPSYSTEQAYFLFEVSDGLFVVEAKNRYAVQAIELMVGDDNTVAPGVKIMAVFRGCDVGIRQGITDISYAVFIAKVANKDLIASSPALKECIAVSLSPEDRLELADIAQYIRENPEAQEEASEAEEEASEMGIGAPSNAAVNLESALAGLGYSKANIKRFVASLGSRVSREPINTLLREGIRNLTS